MFLSVLCATALALSSAEYLMMGKTAGVPNAPGHPDDCLFVRFVRVDRVDPHLLGAIEESACPLIYRTVFDGFGSSDYNQCFWFIVFHVLSSYRFHIRRSKNRTS